MRVFVHFSAFSCAAILALLAWLAPHNALVLGAALFGLAVLTALVFFLERGLFRPLNALSKHCATLTQGRTSDAVFPNSLAPLATNIRQLADALREKNAFASMILDSIITPMVIVDSNDRITWLNASLVRLTEQDDEPDAFLGRPLGQFFYGDDRETVSGKAMHANARQFAKTQMQSRKDNTKYISVAATPLHDAAGHIQGAFTTIMDFTNIKLKEDQILAQNERIATGARQALEIAHKVATLVEHVAAQIENSSQGVSLQQMRTAEVATAIDQMNATIREVARNAGDASLAATQTEQTVSDGTRIIQDVLGVMDQVNTKIRALKKEMNALGNQAEGIGKIMAVINDIADQTNLLALNAAIEAARAGTAGRGFAVVADEVRKLAEKTMHATSEVSQYIHAIQDSARNSIQATDGTATVIDQASDLTQSANVSLEAIRKLVAQTGDQVRAIATATEEQSAASEQIGRSTAEVHTISQTTVAVMKDIETGVGRLGILAQDLEHAMDRMQTQQQ